LLLYSIDRVKTQLIFDLDPYESRREALPGSRLLEELVFYQMLKDPSQRGLARIVNESQDAQAALGGHSASNTLANALCQRDLEQMIEARALLLAHYSPNLARLGKKFARVAAVDASLIKLSLDALDWAKYLEHAGTAKITLRLVSYQLTDCKLIRVLTDRHDLSVLSIALLYKERRIIETLFGR
jgi:hypothetical protein